MTRTKLLFVCSRNQWRSPTAERIYAHSPEFDVRSRGVSKSAVRRLTSGDIAWADVIFAMEHTHKTRIVSLYRDGGDALSSFPILHVLNIPDEFRFMDPELIQLIESAVPQGLLSFAVDRILYDVWDPIGVAGTAPRDEWRAPRDEYRRYVDGVIALIQGGADEAAVVAHLSALEQSAMAIDGSPERTRSAANALVALNQAPS